MMTAQEAIVMKESSQANFSINILDPTRNCPAHPFVDHHLVADFKDANALNRLSDISDVITYEIELGNAEALIKLQDNGAKIFPTPQTLRIIQDKFIQKKFLRSKGIPVTDFAEVSNAENLTKTARDFGFPVILKDRRDSYDGRGNYPSSNIEELRRSYETLERSHRSLMLEKFVPFEKEVSVIAARGFHGNVRTFPVGENIHAESILKMTIMPARIRDAVAYKATMIAREVVDAFKDIGVFGVEMFVVDGNVLVNEVAPRVHNTGHGTLEHDAFSTSQFEQHLRAISGLPLGNTAMMRPVVMHNILGEDNGFSGSYKILGEEEVSMIPGAHLHLYGKEEVRPKRKMGHISIVGGENFKTQEGGESEPALYARYGENPDRTYDISSLPILIARAEQARRLLQFVPVG